ncbi:hypothetical protein DFS34DRAFT_260977 [Phlyctochytrium arcticum]|nr:hypothetical protein DFS34DRAFT_260977 [Phlyctochytrium arcticum]
MTNSTEIASKSEDMKRYFWDRVKRNDFTLSKFLKHIEYAAGESTNAISDLEACVARAEANIVDLRDASQKTKLSKVLETVTESICQAKEGKDVVWKSHWEDLASQLRIKTQAGKRQAAAGDVLVLEEEERAIQATQRKRSRDAVAAPNLAVDSREDLGNQPKKSKCASFDDDDDSAECIVNGEIQTQDADGNVVALSVDYLQKTFVGNKKAVSAEDLICGKVNLSEWLRSTQSALVRKYSTQPTVAFSLQEIGHILLLHHIILFSEKYRISTWTTHKDPRIVKAWSRLVSAEQMERMDARLPENVRDALQNFFHELSSGGNFMDIWKKHTAEHMKIIEDNMPWRMLIVVRSL